MKNVIDDNPILSFIITRFVNTLLFFKNIDSYQIGVSNIPHSVLPVLSKKLAIKRVSLKNIAINLSDAINVKIKNNNIKGIFNLVLAIYCADNYKFIRFLNQIKQYSLDNSNILICGLLEKSCQCLEQLGIVDLQLPNHKSLLDSISSVGYVQPVITVDTLSIKYQNFELLFADLKFFFFYTKLFGLLDQYRDNIKQKFDSCLLQHGCFMFNLEFYFVFACKQ